MIDVDTPPKAPEPDRTTRVAALWATAVAVPVTLLVGVLAFMAIQPENSDKSDKKQAQPVPSTAVAMAAPALDERAELVCLAVTSQLPSTVRDLPARPVSAGPEQNAAYGEPPLTVQCGVPQPAMCTTLGDATPGCVPLDTELLIMNNVCWFADDSTGTPAFTTMDREVPVRVTVPAAYENPAQWANEFSDTVVKTVKSTADDKQPYGCNN